jgi:transposase
LRLIDLLEDEKRELESELRRFARADRRRQALETIYGIGPIIACHILAELGEAKRFRRARSAVGAAGLDPVVADSGETARRGRLAKHAHQSSDGRSCKPPTRPDSSGAPTVPSTRASTSAATRPNRLS